MPEIETTALVIASVVAPAILTFPVAALAAIPVVLETSLGDEALRSVGAILVLVSASYAMLVPICLSLGLLLRRFSLLRRHTLYFAAIPASILLGLRIGFRWLAQGEPDRAIPAAIFFALLVAIASVILIEAWLTIALQLSIRIRRKGASH